MLIAYEERGRFAIQIRSGLHHLRLFHACLLLGAALAGRDAVNLVKSKLLHSAGKTRYYAGLTLFVTCFGSNMLFAYLELTDVLKVGAHPWLYTMLSLDLAAIFGMVLMGPEFFHKLKRIFVWEGETD